MKHLTETVAWLACVRPRLLASEATKHLMKFYAAPLAFVVAFLAFGTPNAVGVYAVESVTGLNAGVGGCALAYQGPGTSSGGPCGQGTVPYRMGGVTWHCVPCEDLRDSNSSLNTFSLAAGTLALFLSPMPIAAVTVGIVAVTAGWVAQLEQLEIPSALNIDRSVDDE